MKYAIATAICMFIFFPLALIPIVLWIGAALSKKDGGGKDSKPQNDIPPF